MRFYFNEVSKNYYSKANYRVINHFVFELTINHLNNFVGNKQELKVYLLKQRNNLIKSMQQIDKILRELE